MLTVDEILELKIANVVLCGGLSSGGPARSTAFLVAGVSTQFPAVETTVKLPGSSTLEVSPSPGVTESVRGGHRWPSFALRPRPVRKRIAPRAT